MPRMPDFLIIGAARSGTTALHAYLRQHPSVFMPAVKECNFFAFEGEKLCCKGPGADYINNSATDLATYEAIFANVLDDVVCGEASPLYLFAEKSAARIYAHIPDVSLIVILRNPIEQAYSHFMYASKNRIEDIKEFTVALQSEEHRMALGWQPLFAYSQFPRYAEQLERYFAIFPREQILIRTYEDLVEAPGQLIADIFQLIGVDRNFQPDMGHRPNAGGQPKSARFQDFLMKSNPVTGAIGKILPYEMRMNIRDRLSSINLKRNQFMPREARRILRERLIPEIENLETLIGRDLSSWRA